MRHVITPFAALVLVFSGCSRIAERHESDAVTATSPTAGRAGDSTINPAADLTSNTNTSVARISSADSPAKGKPVGYQMTDAQTKALPLETEAAKLSETAMERKVIRNASLTVETPSPADGQRRVSAIAEAHSGFVVTSELDEHAREDRSRPGMTVTIVARVPASEFSAVVEEIHHLRGDGSHVRQEKISGQDVTEEYVDVEARIKTKKALETQFLEIMKQAHRVSDALEVQSELENVRTDIERMEGRRRYLDNQSSLSTINVTLQPVTPIVNTSTFSYSARQAFGDGFDAAESITLFLIRFVIALIPIVVLIILPIGMLVRVLVRRAGRLRLARQMAEEPQIEIKAA